MGSESGSKEFSLKKKWFPNRLKDWAELSCCMVFLYRCILQTIVIKTVDTPRDFEMVEVPYDFVAYIGITLNGFALIGIHRKRQWMYYLPSLMYTPVDALLTTAFGVFCFYIGLHGFGIGVLILDLLFLFYMIALVDLFIHRNEAPGEEEGSEYSSGFDPDIFQYLSESS